MIGSTTRYAGDDGALTIPIDCTGTGLQTLHTVLYLTGHAPAETTSTFEIVATEPPTIVKTGDDIHITTRPGSTLKVAFSTSQHRTSLTQASSPLHTVSLVDLERQILVAVGDSAESEFLDEVDVHWEVVDPGTATVHGTYTVDMSRTQLLQFARDEGAEVVTVSGHLAADAQLYMAWGTPPALLHAWVFVPLCRWLVVPLAGGAVGGWCRWLAVSLAAGAVAVGSGIFPCCTAGWLVGWLADWLVGCLAGLTTEIRICLGFAFGSNVFATCTKKQKSQKSQINTKITNCLK
jgi:hypothetical protein